MVGAAVDEMTPIVEGQVESIQLTVEIPPRHRRDGRVDLNHIDAGALAGELPGHDYDTQPDAQSAVDGAGVSAGQIMQQVGEQGGTFFLDRVIYVLGQVIVQIKP